MENVVAIPRKSLSLSKNVDMSPLHIVNNYTSRMAFKLKTTRSHSLKPNVTCGFLEPNGGCVHIRVAFKPAKKEKKLNENDRLTIIMKPAPMGAVVSTSCLGLLMGREQVWERGGQSSKGIHILDLYYVMVR